MNALERSKFDRLKPKRGFTVLNFRIKSFEELILPDYHPLL